MVKFKKIRFTLKSRNSFYGYLFVLPWIIGFIFTFLYPMILSILFSFSEVKLSKAGFYLENVGIKNYKDALLTNAQFPQHLFSTIVDIFYSVPIILVFSFFVAVLLKESFKGQGVAKTIFFLPVIMSSGLFILLQSNFGQITTTTLDQTMNNAAQSVQILRSINLSKYLLEIGIPYKWISILTSPIDRIYTVISNSGIQIFIFLAGLNSISPSLYEACYMEGGTKWETFWKITFPMMTPLILVNIIYSIVDSFTAITNQLISFIYELAFVNFKFGLSTAMSWIYSILLLTLMALVFKIMSKRIFYYT